MIPVEGGIPLIIDDKIVGAASPVTAAVMMELCEGDRRIVEVAMPSIAVSG